MPSLKVSERPQRSQDAIPARPLIITPSAGRLLGLPQDLGEVCEEDDVPAGALAARAARQLDELAPSIRCEGQQLLAHFEAVGHRHAQPPLVPRSVQGGQRASMHVESTCGATQ